VPEVDELLATQIAEVVRSIRQLELKKAPSISETIDWARTLVYLERRSLDPGTVDDTLHLLLKHERDIQRARAELGRARSRVEG
jgi:MoxR-like ATPase